MIVFRGSGFLVLAMSALLTTVSDPPLATLVAQTDTRAKIGDLQLIVEIDVQRYRVDENPSFKVSFHNSGNENLLLNGGGLLGNGEQIWSSISCEFQGADGQRWPLALGWGVPRVGGRIYFLGVPLRSGSSYTVSVTPKDYYLGKNERLVVGTYSLVCTYRGSQSNYRDSAQLPACWEGLITSNSTRMEVIETNR